MTNKHTPGPWTEAGIVGERFNIMAGAYAVAHVVMDGGHISDKAAYANARLIATAPDQNALLVEALDLVPRISDDDPMAPALAEWCRKVKSVLSVGWKY